MTTVFKSTLNLSTLFLSAAMLTACGGGSDSSDDNGNESNNDTSANLTVDTSTENGDTTTNTTTDANSDSGTAANSDLSASSGPAADIVARYSGKTTPWDLSGSLEGTSHPIDIASDFGFLFEAEDEDDDEFDYLDEFDFDFDEFSKQSKSVSAKALESFTLPCAISGTVTSTIESSDIPDVIRSTYRDEYDNCEEQPGYIENGYSETFLEANYHSTLEDLTSYSPELNEHTVSFSESNVNDSTMFKSSLTSHSTNLDTNEELLIENFMAEFMVEDESGISFGTLSGNIYHSAYGRLTLSTPEPIQIFEVSVIAGLMRYDGANNSYIELEFNNDDTFTVSIDEDGDGVVDSETTYAAGSEF